MANMNGRAQQQALLSWLSLTPSSPSPPPASSSSSASPVTSFAFAFECNFNYTTLRFLPGCVSCGSVCVILMFYACRTLQPVTCYLLDIVIVYPLSLSLSLSLSVDPLPFVLWLDCLANAMQISTLISGHSIDIQFSTHCS